jgi:hypothetical protein
VLQLFFFPLSSPLNSQLNPSKSLGVRQWVQIMAKIQVVLAPFTTFTSFYNPNKAYNMLSLMLDPRFKSLDVVKAFIGHAKVI